MEAVPELPLVCYYRDRPHRFEEQVHPIGAQWEIGKAWEWFHESDDIWDGSMHMGFRILFSPGRRCSIKGRWRRS